MPKKRIPYMLPFSAKNWLGSATVFASELSLMNKYQKVVDPKPSTFKGNIRNSSRVVLGVRAIQHVKGQEQNRKPLKKNNIAGPLQIP